MVYGLTTFAIMLILSSCTTPIREEDRPLAAPRPVILMIEETPEVKGDHTVKTTEEDGFSILSAEGGLQSAVLTLSYPESADLSLLSLEGGGYITRINAAGGIAKIDIAGLESLSSYSLSLSYDGETVAAFDIATGSFAGRYSWKPADGSDADPFVLSVKEAPSSSGYRYYVYLDPSDSAYPEERNEDEIRIAPLVDEGEPSLDGMKYKDAPDAYKWTNRKWNTGSMTPSRIKYVKAVDTKTEDEIHTLIASVALGFTAEADVRFAFHECEGMPYLTFHNRMTPDIANSFLKKNPSPGIRPFEVDGYSYTLEREL